VVTGPNDVDEIYHRMALIRRDLHAHVSESVAGAEAVVDWGRYTWTYPWIAVGTAAAVGCLIYAGGHQKVAADTASLADGAMAGESAAGDRIPGREDRSRTIQNLLYSAWGILLPVAVAAGQNYVLHWLEQQYPTRTVERSLAIGRGAGRPDGPGGAVGH